MYNNKGVGKLIPTHFIKYQTVITQVVRLQLLVQFPLQAH